MTRGGRYNDVRVDLVHHGKVDSGEFVGGGEGRKERSGGVGCSGVKSGEGGILDGVAGVSPECDATGQAYTSRSRKFGQILDVELGGTGEIGLFVGRGQIGSLATLETDLESRCGGEGGFEGLGTVGFELGLVEGEAGIGEFGADFGGEGSGGGTGGVDGYGDGSSWFFCI